MSAYLSGLIVGFVVGLAIAGIAFFVWLAKEPPLGDPDDEP